MSQLAYLRQKIKSIQTTQKITHAVRLISMSFYNRLDKKHQPLMYYSATLKTIFGQLLRQTPEWSNQLFLPQDLLDQRPLYIIVSTSKGLCGSLNANLLRYVEQAVFIEQHQAPAFIAIGSKAIAYVKERKLQNVLAVYAEVNSANLSALTEELLRRILDEEQPYSSVSVFSSEVKSFFVQRPAKTTLLPLALDHIKGELAEEEAWSKEELLWEQPAVELLERVAMRYLHCSIMQLLFNAMRAEQAARFLAMDSSTNNAQKYLEPLTMQFNKMRQALITKELAEISSGGRRH